MRRKGRQEAAKQRRVMNGSGFFVFNAEDIKNMTEMSPKNKSGRVNYSGIGQGGLQDS